jgi:hypothetical protein
MKHEPRNKGCSPKCQCGGHIKWRPVNKKRPQAIQSVCIKCGKIH